VRAQQNVVKIKDFRSLALMEGAIMPGPSSGGLINLFALLQNSWLLIREKGRKLLNPLTWWHPSERM